MKYLGKLKPLPSSAITDSRVGIGFECLDRELFDPARCFDLIGASGIKHARCQTGWNRCETVKGVYDFAWLDNIVDNLRSRGVQPWFNVGFGNPLYMNNISSPTAVGCVPLFYGDETLQAWKKYIAALTAHFRGRVTDYEIWNEPDLQHFWYPETPDPVRYAELVNLTGDIIRSLDPDARIGACSSRALARDYDISGFVWNFLSRVRHLDFFCYHEYSIMPEKNFDEDIRLLRAELDANGFTSCEIRNGECGYPSWFPKDHSMQPKTQGSERQQAVGHLRYIFLDAAAGVTRTSIFMVVDLIQKLYQTAAMKFKNPTRQGILHGLSYEPKLTYHSLSVISTLLAGKTAPANLFFSPQTPKNDGNTSFVRSVALTHNGRPLYAYWRPSHIEEEVPTIPDAVTPLIDAMGDHKLVDPILVDPLDGSVYKLSYTSDRGSVASLEKLPLADYPLVVCESLNLDY